MPTPNTELNTNVEINSLSMNVDTSNDNISDLILINSTDANVDDFDNMPLDFDSSNSPMETMESMEESLKLGTNLPMLTDIAEETVYETEFFDETLKADEKCDKNEQLEKEKFISEPDDHDISNILIDPSVLEFSSKTAVNTMDSSSINENDVLCEPFSNDADNKNETKDNNNDSNSQLNTTIGNNEIYFASSSSPAASATEVSNLITISNNTNLASGLIGNISSNNLSSDKNSSMNVGFVTANVKNNLYPNISNVIHVNSINNNKKISTLKPYAFQSTSKFVPISIAPVNPGKRPANISIGQPATNVLTKVIVSQGKVGQPFVITNSSKPKPLCVFPNTSSSSSPVKSITAAQAKQMGIKLQPIRPSTTKTLKQKIVISSIPPNAQVLKKIHPISKPATPTKILPAPLVSKSTSAGQPTKIYVTQDYVMKAGTLIPKQPGNQVITISNLQPAPVVSNHVSPKKQVQYIKLINNVGSTNVPTVASAKGKITTVTQNSTVSKIDKDTPIIVASSNITPGNLNIKGTNSVQTAKAVGPPGITVLPVLSPNLKTTPGQRLILPAVSKGKVESTNQPLLTETNQLKTSANIVVLPEDVLEKIKGELLSNPVKFKDDTKNSDFARLNYDNQESIPSASDFRGGTKSPTKQLVSVPLESGNGLRSRKPCNCTRSQCLKLYCECFANGEFCNNCNCVSCHNNISHEENRQHAIRSCLDRNPQAFRPKIGKCLVGQNDRRHTKGCHCKRSGCLKNYCECYEAQIPCSENCKCVGCKNIDEMLFATTYSSSCNTFEKPDSQLEFQTFSKNKLTAEINDAVGQSGNSNPRHAFSFIKDQVVEATCQCLLAQADEVKRRNINVEDGKKYILEEFGRCLIQIIECAPDKYVPS